MNSLIEAVQTRVEEWLDDGYLFDHDHKRIRSNMKLLVVLLLVADLVTALASLFIENKYDMRWVAWAPIVVGVAVFWLLSKLRDPRPSLMLVSFYILMSTWTILIFSGTSLLYMFWLLLYPVAICFFLGNRFGIPFLLVLSANLIVYYAPIFDVWRDKLFMMHQFVKEVQAPFLVAFFFACLFGIAVEHLHARTNMHLAILASKITENSYKDPLTSLLTRRAFYERYSREIEELGAVKPVFMIMSDVDHFKSVNDTYGHHIGDEVLKHVSKILQQYAMGKNLCFRWGGEEFIMFVSEKTLQNAIAAANRIRVVLEHSPYVDQQIGSLKCTMSFGVHQYDRTLTMDKNVSVVDGYLYEAKHNGRNRVESAPLS